MANISAIDPTVTVFLLPADKPVGNLELVTFFESSIGVVVSKAGRIFISYPRRVDEVKVLLPNSNSRIKSWQMSQ